MTGKLVEINSLSKMIWEGMSQQVLSFSFKREIKNETDIETKYQYKLERQQTLLLV